VISPTSILKGTYMAQSSYHGRFVWHELFSNDSGAAAAFYSRVMGWQAQPFSPGSPYLLFSNKAGRALAGAMALSDEARAMGTTPHWRSYIGASDVDAVVAQASRLGARILEPARDLPAVGRAAMLADPEGTRFGVYRPLTDMGATGPGESGFSWCELAARWKSHRSPRPRAPSPRTSPLGVAWCCARGCRLPRRHSWPRSS
jgi:predicted enzyme related to lactoylglutathione lyase